MTAVNPFIFSDAATQTYYFITDLPHLGFIHLSKLSIDELKGLAQFFNFMATKHGRNLFSSNLHVIGFLALTIIGGLAFFFSINLELPPIISFSTFVLIGIGLVGFLANAIKHGNNLNAYNRHKNWENYTLEILSLKMNPIEISS